MPWIIRSRSTRGRYARAIAKAPVSGHAIGMYSIVQGIEEFHWASEELERELAVCWTLRIDVWVRAP